MEVSAGTWNRNNRIGGELVSWQRSSEHSVIYQHGWYRNTKLNNDSRHEVQPRVYCSQLACNGFVHMEKSLPAFWPILRPPRQRRPASHQTTHASWPLFSGCQRADGATKAGEEELRRKRFHFHFGACVTADELSFTSLLSC